MAVAELTEKAAAAGMRLSDLSLEDYRATSAHFEADVFSVLEQAGAVRDELQLAWDFTTGSDRHVRDLLAVRDTFVAALTADGPEYEVRRVEPDPHPNVAFLVEGIARIPSLLLPADELQIRRIRRGGDGAAVLEGFEEVAFDIQIPHSAYDAPAAVLQYGHGLLGSRTEAHGGYLREMAQRYNFVIAAIDMQGMNQMDGILWAGIILNDLGRFPHLAEKPVQGVLNHVALARMLRARFAGDTDPRFNPDAKQLVDPDRIYYYGNSQGGTMGNIVMTLHSEVQRGVLGVPGCAFGFLLQRSVDFEPFVPPIRGLFPDGWAMSVVLGIVQVGFGSIEPLDILRHMPASQRVLLHVAKEDAQVHNDVSFLLARTYGVPLVTPAPRPVWGLDEVPAPHAGSAVVEVDFGRPDAPDPVGPPPKEHDTHGSLRKHRPAQDQLWHFLETGEVVNPCDGACDPD